MEKINIHFLGTGDSVPSVKRNHPGFLLTYKDENILVDCGEGIQRQFRYANLNPCKVTKILITHWHGDHVFGLPGMIETIMSSACLDEIQIYGPKGSKENIKNLFKVFNKNLNIKIKVNEISGKFFENDDFYLEAKEMTHGVPCNAYNFVVKGKIRIDCDKIKKIGLKGPILKNFKEGKDISFEGKKYKFKDYTYKDENRKVSFVLDTTLNSNISKFVKDSDILISESTFDIGMDVKAKEHGHMTVEQVASIAKKSKVKKLYLVHVSQRYSKDMRSVLENSKKIFKESYLPKDLDSVSI